ncbi:unnamed protein product [Urochloa humidicola]
MCLEAPILSSFDSNNTCRAPTECQGHLFANPQALRTDFFAVIGTHDDYQPKEGVVFKHPPIWSLITCPGFSGFATDTRDPFSFAAACDSFPRVADFFLWVFMSSGLPTNCD